MSLRDDLIDRLERENDELRARVRHLEELAGVALQAPLEFRLTRNEAVIFGLLMKHQMVRRHAIMTELYLHAQDEAEIKIIDVWVCKMRAKLKPYQIRIETVWGEGFAMPAASKAIAQNLLDSAEAAA